jgi:hypothetical protein
MSITDTVIQEILEAGVAAPSGDNCQPWRFEVRGDVIRLFNIPERDVSQYNFRQRASLIAHGAVIENMTISASAHGLRADTSLFPDGAESNLIAEMRLVPVSREVDPLFEAIAVRCTNRRRYRGGELDRLQRDTLIAAASPFPEARVRIFMGSEQQRVAQVIGLNDRLVFENRDLHSFLFDHIRWNDKEAEVERDGMDIRTLELAPPDAIAFKLFKNFGLVRFFNNFGVSRIIGANARKLAMSAAALGIITMPGTDAVNHVICGRAMERVWLESAKQGLAFQLMTGITCLMGRVAAGDPGTLSLAQETMVRDGRSQLAELLGSQSEVPMIIFRVGKADPPTARSVRLPVRI